MQHKMKIHGLFIVLCGWIVFTISAQAQASRVAEIEEFYLNKTRDFLQLRFPDKPFSVSVIVDTGRNEPTRTELARDKRNTGVTNLPYLDIEEEEMDIWDRTDVPLTTLIGQLRKVELQIQIDSSMSDEDITALQESLAQHLKLDASIDSVKIYKMDWTKLERYRTYGWVSAAFGVAILLLFGVFYMLAKFSVRNLVKGLSAPISEIGKSTQKFANDALSMATGLSTPAGGRDQRPKTPTFSDIQEDELSLGSNLLEIRENALELIEKNKDFFSNPDATLMEFINKRGEQDPSTMGSILAELERDSLRHLFENGSGDWWYVAIAHPGPLTPRSIAVLSEIDKLRIRMTFNETSQLAHIKEEFKEEGLIFSRIPLTNLEDIFADLPIEKALSIFEVMPKIKALKLAKEMYPGQWAAFLLDRKNQEPIDRALLSKFVMEAQNRYPKRTDQSIQKFFENMDLSIYLDSANTRDERDFYVALPKDSDLLDTRTPFFSIFDATGTVLKTLGTAISPEDWALVLTHVEHIEKEKLLSNLPERLAFRIHEESRKVHVKPEDENYIRSLKRTLVAAYIEESNKSQQDVQDLIDEIAATKSIADDTAA
ncbi:MAG: hypothetical protein R2827_16345 [Bdellovibrionales bacterium]